MNTHDTVLRAGVSRRTFLKGAGAGAAGFTLAQIAFVRSAAAQSESIQDILNITATTERFGVTILGEGLRSNEEGNFDKPWPENVVAVVTAARAQEQFHLDEFERLGGEPLVDTFTVPPEVLTSFDAFFTAVVEQETRETASQIAAMNTFAALGRADIAKVSFQYAAEESEHRLLANYTRGVRPANDLAFAPAPYETVNEFLAELKSLGLIGGSGTEITYPGPGEIDATGVINTTPDGPAVACAPTDMPGAGGGGLDLTPGGVPGSLGMLGLLGLGAAAIGLRNRKTSERALAEAPRNES